MKRISIREVATHAGVSPSTVSRVLNGHDANHMRPETKDRIVAAIKELNYTPVKAAQRLRRQRTHALGILVPDITNLYFALLTRGVESVAFDREFTTLICDSNHNPKREVRYLDMLLSEDVEGVLYVPVGRPDRATVRRLLAHGVQMMLVDRRAPDLPAVEADNRRASRGLAEHILELGYRRLAYVAGPTDVSTAEDRLDGFRDALAAARMEPADVQRGGFTFESGYECATRILDGDGADVIVAANDLMAFGVLRAIEERGLSVPRDLGVAGFDHIPHIPYATFMHPELTTVEVPVHEMGREAARRLLDGGCDGVHVPTKLIRGGTCRQQERSHG
jgi:LacI family transcriptional regulator